ncbi:HAD-IA family hydrolase [Geminocystis herdmanii]|uniref:HAD-IA family hydrolase n=1 Tax=Geminocystis herdmanii TaxID=669359 RepID=UPI0003475B99|nr:HAD-IA family hydrolase [Geminocystis herdmanii]
MTEILDSLLTINKLYLKENNLPQVIFLDAVGTIFGVKNSVGYIYTKLAQKYGVNASPEKIDRAFYDIFKQSSPLAFETKNEAEIKELEFKWWETVTYNTFNQDGSIAQRRFTIEQFSNFTEYFQELYEYFKTAECWVIYEEVIAVLNEWQNQGIKLAIISNFDTRIFTVLDNLELSKYFSTITISSLTGVAKPNPKIFLNALAKHHCQPEKAWYIGDSFKEDYEGSKSVGMQSFWLQRTN